MAREDTAALYDQDFSEWTARNAELLRRGSVEEADLELQPERRYTASGASRRLSTIRAPCGELDDLFEQAPSLKRYAEQAVSNVHRSAIQRVSAETGILIKQFPAECPFRFGQVLEDEFLPE
jgi:hypothetical protein